MSITTNRSVHLLAGKTVKVQLTTNAVQLLIDGARFVVDDWWINVAGKSWMVCEGNPACLIYAMRSGFGGLPMDNEVVYGHVGPLGYLVHVSELGEEVAP